MTTQMVLFAIGPDRPGLVSRISSIIHDNGGNFEDSRMTTLAGDFALIILFAASADAMAQIQTECAALEGEMAISCHFKKPSEKSKEVVRNTWQFEATGHDRPGIVSRLTTAMAGQGVSVITMDTSMANMAFIGTPMFRIKGELNIPETMDATLLRDNLEEICEDMALVLEFTPMK
ncbi:MAG: hypothetical protein JXR76_31350 [Deltaproteobacteria bacterium]|nr:hypothetical protein [Deltaproteobacteria bacterium]